MRPWLQELIPRDVPLCKPLTKTSNYSFAALFATSTHPLVFLTNIRLRISSNSRSLPPTTFQSDRPSQRLASSTQGRILFHKVRIEVTIPLSTCTDGIQLACGICFDADVAKLHLSSPSPTTQSKWFNANAFGPCCLRLLQPSNLSTLANVWDGRIPRPMSAEKPTLLTVILP